MNCGVFVAVSSMPMPMKSSTAGATSSTPRIAAATSVSIARVPRVTTAPKIAENDERERRVEVQREVQHERQQAA